jgi:hypothetical protein
MILTFLCSLIFETRSEAYCDGEWGHGNKGNKMSGQGKCVWKLGFSTVFSNDSIFLGETTYEGQWLLGR